MLKKIGPLILHLERCKRCGICMELCPRKVYTRTNDGYPNPTNIEKCNACQFCELWCPDYAIEVEVSENAA